MSDGSRTEKNLNEAFSGESQANRKYLAFAKQADKEGLTQVAKLFRAAAEAETIHAHSHLKALKGIAGTRENLLEAIAGETHEFQSMYPQMIIDAEQEGAADALRAFKFANAVEAVHARLYQAALDSLGSGVDAFDYFICPVCGHTVEREAPERCEVCGAAGRVFFIVQ